VTDDRLELLAAWFRRECRQTNVSEVSEYAKRIGMTMHAQDAIDLFHYINNKREDQYDRHYEPAS
jgi:hypothetical protein